MNATTTGNDDRRRRLRCFAPINIICAGTATPCAVDHRRRFPKVAQSSRNGPYSAYSRIIRRHLYLASYDVKSACSLPVSGCSPKHVTNYGEGNGYIEILPCSGKFLSNVSIVPAEKCSKVGKTPFFNDTLIPVLLQVSSGELA